MDNKFVVNIGRQLGSGGREIGEKLAVRLGIDFYDKELINLASEESGLCREFFEKADEKASQGIIGGLFGMRFPFISDGAMPATNCLSNDALFKVQSDVIRKLDRETGCGEILLVRRGLRRLHFAGYSALCQYLYFRIARRSDSPFMPSALYFGERGRGENE